MISIGNLKILKHHIFWKKTLVLAIICSKYKNEDKKLFKEEESIEVLTILGLIESRKKKHDKIVSLVKSKLNRIDF